MLVNDKVAKIALLDSRWKLTCFHKLQDAAGFTHFPLEWPRIFLGNIRRKRRKRVLDPMAGSGTTLVVARATGHQAIGFDTDPLAILLSRVWSCNCEPERIVRAGKRTLKRAKKLASSKHAEPWPAGADQETIAFVRYWFDARAGWGARLALRTRLRLCATQISGAFCGVLFHDSS